jgi:hypothetical protein
MKIMNNLPILLAACVFGMHSMTTISAMAVDEKKEAPASASKQASAGDRVEKGFFVGGGDHKVEGGDLIEMAPNDPVKCKSIWASGFMDPLNGDYAPWYKGVPSAIAIGCHVVYKNGDQKVFLTAYAHKVIEIDAKFNHPNENYSSTDYADFEHIKKIKELCSELNQHIHKDGGVNPIEKCSIIIVQPEWPRFECGLGIYLPHNPSQVEDLVRSILKNLMFDHDATIIETRYDENELLLMDYEERIRHACLAQKNNHLGTIGSKIFLKEFEIILRTDGIKFESCLQYFHFQKENVINFFKETHHTLLPDCLGTLFRGISCIRYN